MCRLLQGKPKRGHRFYWIDTQSLNVWWITVGSLCEMFGLDNMFGKAVLVARKEFGLVGHYTWGACVCCM